MSSTVKEDGPVSPAHQRAHDPREKLRGEEDPRSLPLPAALDAQDCRSRA